jgi:hypothetical protein
MGGVVIQSAAKNLVVTIGSMKTIRVICPANDQFRQYPTAINHKA